MAQQSTEKTDIIGVSLKELSTYSQHVPDTKNVIPPKILYTVNAAAILSHWIYKPEEKNDNYIDINQIKITKTDTTKYQNCQWALVKYKNCLNKLFLVFRGTDIENPIDILTDISSLPTPIYPLEDPKLLNIDDNNDFEDEIFVHTGINTKIRRDYKKIWLSILKYKIKYKFDELIICGHSLGGGLSTIFALISIINNHFNDKGIYFQIITFGSPNTISIRNKFTSLSQESQLILNSLKVNTYNFINQYDIVPRLLVSKKWWYFVLDIIINGPKLLGENVGTAALEVGVDSLLRFGVTTAELLLTTGIIQTKASSKHTSNVKNNRKKYSRINLPKNDEVLIFGCKKKYDFDQRTTGLVTYTTNKFGKWFQKLCESSHELDTYQSFGKCIINCNKNNKNNYIINDDYENIKLLLSFLPKSIIQNNILDEICECHKTQNYVSWINKCTNQHLAK